MNVLLVQNDIDSPHLLARAFSPAHVQIVPRKELNTIHEGDFDFAVLSGSSDFPIVGNEVRLQSEIEFIKSSTLPMLGICFGFELIVAAFGGILERGENKEQGVLHISLDAADPIFDGIVEPFVYEGHHWHVHTVPESLVQLAHSSSGIEAVRHKDRPIYGLQFHPEKLQKETDGPRIIQNFVSIVTSGSTH